MVRLASAKRAVIQAERALGMSKAEICRKHHYARSTVDRWSARDDTTARNSTGRRRLLGTRQARSAYKMLMGKKHLSARDAAHALQARLGPKVKLAPSTLIRAATAYADLHNMPIHCDKSHKPQEQLSKKAMDARVQFCMANCGRDWGRVMFTDRKQFILKYPGCKVYPSQWVHKGERRQAPRAVGKPISLNVYLGITARGPTKCHYVVGTTGKTSQYKTKKGAVSKGICASEYEDVLLNTLLPEGERIFGYGKMWVFQQDGDRSHCRGQKVVKMYKRKHKRSRVQFLAGWPAHSPDLSPVENFWGWLQQKVNQHSITTVAMFQKTLEHYINEAATHLFGSYFESMKNRLQLCIGTGGRRIRY